MLEKGRPRTGLTKLLSPILNEFFPSKAYWLLLALSVLLLLNLWEPAAADNFAQHNVGRLPNIDFFSYYTAGKSFRDGYNPYLDNGHLELALSDPRVDGYSRFIYPPTFLPFYESVSAVDYSVARVLWALTYATVFALCFMVFALGVERSKRAVFIWIGILLFLTSYPVLLHIRQGQIDLIVSSVGMISYYSHLKGRKLASASLLSLIVLLKVSPAILLIYFVVFWRDWIYLAYFALASLVLIGASLVAVPWNLYSFYLSDVLPSISGGDSYFYNQSVLRFFSDSQTLSVLVSVVGILLLVIFALRMGKPRSSGQERVSLDSTSSTPAGAVFLMSILVMLLFTAISWSMAYVWVIIPSSLLLANLLGTARRWYLVAAALATVLMNAKVFELPVLDSLNMIGAGLMIACLFLLLLRRAAVIGAPVGTARES
jgi:hypothetical protein